MLYDFNCLQLHMSQHWVVFIRPCSIVVCIMFLFLSTQTQEKRSSMVWLYVPMIYPPTPSCASETFSLDLKSFFSRCYCIWIIYSRLKNKKAFWFHMNIFFFLIPGCEGQCETLRHDSWITQCEVCSTCQKNPPRRAKLCKREKIKAHQPLRFLTVCLQRFSR